MHTPTAVPLDATILSHNSPQVTPTAARHYDLSYPRSLRSPSSSSNYSYAVGSDEIKALRSQGFTVGLAESLSDVRDAFPLRIWVVDNSGSMMNPDGHRIISTSATRSAGASGNEVKIVDCTRWDEIKEAVMYHIQMCALLEAPTTFRLLNQPGIQAGLSQFDIAQVGGVGVDVDVGEGMSSKRKDAIHNEVIAATDTMTKVRPGGATPLTRHMRDIYATVSSMKDELEASGRRVAIILATDGLPTDEIGMSGSAARQEFVSSLQRLQGLPVWLVIRLCTDENDVVNFYNELDDELELSMDVLDDFVGEAREVYQHNAWLTYALPLHRMREMGYHDRVFDMLDERTLTKGELRDFCRLLFGIRRFDGVEDPSEDWPSFARSVEQLLRAEELQYDPITKKMMPWIDIKRLNRIYGGGDGVGSGCKCNVM